MELFWGGAGRGAAHRKHMQIGKGGAVGRIHVVWGQRVIVKERQS